MKTTITAILIILMSAATISETKAQYGVQAGILSPTGDWSDAWGLGFGGQVFYKRSQGDNIRYGGSIGFFRTPGETFSILGASFEFEDANIIPILATFDYLITDQFYVGGDAGYNVISIGDGDDGFSGAAGSSFALIPKAGAQFGPAIAEARFNITGDAYFSLLIGLSFGGN